MSEMLSSVVGMQIIIVFFITCNIYYSIKIVLVFTCVIILLFQGYYVDANCIQLYPILTAFISVFQAYIDANYNYY